MPQQLDGGQPVERLLGLARDLPDLVLGLLALALREPVEQLDDAGRELVAPRRPLGEVLLGALVVGAQLVALVLLVGDGLLEARVALQAQLHRRDQPLDAVEGVLGLERRVVDPRREVAGVRKGQRQNVVQVVDHLLRGAAGLAIWGEGERRLSPGDHIFLPAHLRHRVTWTAPDEPTVWLAVHFGG